MVERQKKQRYRDFSIVSALQSVTALISSTPYAQLHDGLVSKVIHVVTLHLCNTKQKYLSEEMIGERDRSGDGEGINELLNCDERTERDDQEIYTSLMMVALTTLQTVLATAGHSEEGTLIYFCIFIPHLSIISNIEDNHSFPVYVFIIFLFFSLLCFSFLCFSLLCFSFLPGLSLIPVVNPLSFSLS